MQPSAVFNRSLFDAPVDQGALRMLARGSGRSPARPRRRVVAARDPERQQVDALAQIGSSSEARRAARSAPAAARARLGEVAPHAQRIGEQHALPDLLHRRAVAPAEDLSIAAPRRALRPGARRTGSAGLRLSASTSPEAERRRGRARASARARRARAAAAGRRASRARRLCRRARPRPCPASSPRRLEPAPAWRQPLGVVARHERRARAAVLDVDAQQHRSRRNSQELGLREDLALEHLAPAAPVRVEVDEDGLPEERAAANAASTSRCQPAPSRTAGTAAATAQ